MSSQVSAGCVVSKAVKSGGREQAEKGYLLSIGPMHQLPATQQQRGLTLKEQATLPKINKPIKEPEKYKH